MAATQLRIPFGVHESGELLHITDAANGLACACRCPSCNTELVAKQGDIVAWHFSHHNAPECSGGYESAIHYAVKKIIETERSLYLPGCGVLRHPYPVDSPVQGRDLANASGKEKPTCIDVWEYASKQTAEQIIRNHHGMDRFGFADAKAGMVAFDSVISEKNQGDIRPDLIGTSGDRKLYIEVAVTHFIDAEKLEKIRRRGVATVEIVVPAADEVNWETLRKIVLTDSGNTFWRFNPKAEKNAEACFQERFKAAEEKRMRAQREADAKKRIYEQRFKPTHEVSFKSAGYSFRSKIFVRLCPANLNLSVYPYDSTLAAITTLVAREFSGNYNSDYFKWEFSPKENLFYKMVRALRHRAEGLRIASWAYYENPDNEHFLQGIGLKHIGGGQYQYTED